MNINFIKVNKDLYKVLTLLMNGRVPIKNNYYFKSRGLQYYLK